MPAIDRQPSPGQRSRLRALVAASTAGRYRRLRPQLGLGAPDGQQLMLPVSGESEQVRAQIVEVLLERVLEQCAQPWAWLVRPGPPDEPPLWEPRWVGAALGAFAEHGLDPTVVVVGRWWWYDPRTGAGRCWSRLR